MRIKNTYQFIRYKTKEKLKINKKKEKKIVINIVKIQ